MKTDTKVSRYDPFYDDLTESDCGGWVKFEDYERLDAENAALRADKARLDVIESSQWCAMFDPKKGWAVSLNPFYRLQKFYPTLRAAIDAAKGGAK